jgi:regulator of RNase E activity RraA
MTNAPWKSVLEEASTPELFDAARKSQQAVKVVHNLPYAGGVFAGKKLVGPAITVTAHEIARVKRSPQQLQITIGNLAKACSVSGGIVMWSSAPCSSTPVSSFGGLIAKVLASLDVRGVVLNGYFRDVDEVLGLLPVWSRGTTPVSGAGKFDLTFSLGATFGTEVVYPGDIVVCDATGTLAFSPDTDWDRLAKVTGDIKKKEEVFTGALAETKDPLKAVEALQHI